LLDSATTPEDLEAVQQLLDELQGEPPADDLEDNDSDATKLAQAHSDNVNAAQNERTALSQEIGPIPPIKNPKRRESCRYDLERYTMTYFKAACFMGLAPYQKEIIQAFQHVILNGGKKSRAVRRGGLKSTLARIATAWSIDYGHRKFPVLVGATDDKSNEHRDNLFKMLETSKEHCEDFPELIPLLLKRKNPKKTLRLNGVILDVSAKDERGCILFPAIEGADSSEARVAPYSIVSTDVSGLSFVDETGRVIRPDLLIFDDVQTPQSAKSFSQTSTRENAIDTTFQGLAGLGETLATIMVCTRRELDCLTARYCDREKHPDWDGQAFPVLLHEPTDKEGWKKYSDLLREGDNPDDGFAMASAFYRDNRERLDVGGVVAWEDDKEAGYISALQYCMTIKSLKPDFFRSELQQEGAAPEGGLSQLSASELVKRVSNVPWGTVPSQASYLTSFVDSQDHVLFWMVCAWAKDFSGWIVDYGTWPDQGRQEFYKSDLSRTIEMQLPGASWEEAFVNAHNKLDQMLLGNHWPIQDSDSERDIDLLLKDWSDGDHKKRIEPQVLASKFRSRIRPSKGFAPKPGKKPVHLFGDAQKDRHTHSHWVERRTESPMNVQYDANMWKTHIFRRLKTIIGSPSCLLLPGDNESDLSLLAEHFTAELAKPIEYDGSKGIVYERIPNRDNDWFDCIVGNAVAASMLGCALPGEIAQPNHAARRVVQVPQRMVRR